MTKRDSGWYNYASHVSSDGAAEIWGAPEALADYLDAQKYANQFSIFFRQDYLDIVGVNVKDITTEAKLLDTLQQLQDAKLVNESGASVYTLMIQGNNFDVYTLQTLQMHFGAMPVDKDGNYQSYYYNDQYKHAVKFLNQAAQRGFYDENEITMDEPSFVALCNSGRVACYIGGTSALQVGNDTDWVTPGPIESSTGAQPVFPLSSAVSTGWLKTVVSKSTKYPEAVAKFLDYMTSREGMLLAFYGIEGDDYYWDEDGLLHRTEKGIEEREDSISGNYGFYKLVGPSQILLVNRHYLQYVQGTRLGRYHIPRGYRGRRSQPI
ncbi:hypothetical protein FACS1894184_08960 [Clostridia bacterium]|nr:hypothetical protein FACS1894184_08960 [Clostridia bacterium]